MSGPAAPLLEVEALSRRFGGFTAVDRVSFSVAEGEILGLLGPNGSGKSTTFNCIAGMLKPTSGSVLFGGEEIGGLSADQVCRRGIGRTFQNIELFEHATVLQNLLIGRHAHAHRNFLADLLFLPSVRRAELEGLDGVLGESGGEHHERRPHGGTRRGRAGRARAEPAQHVGA